MEYKEAKEYLEIYPRIYHDLNDMYSYLINNYSKDTTIKTLLTDMEDAIDRLDRKAMFYKAIVEKK